MSSKETIAVDIDDVLVPHVQDLIRWHNLEYGTNMSLKDYHSRNPKDWGADSAEQAIKRVQAFFKTPEFTDAKPVEDAYEALGQLSLSHTLIVITSRDNIIEDATNEWLDRNFPKIFKETHFTARFNLEGKSAKKSAIALKSKARYLIDDSLENAADCAEAGLEVLLFGDYPWNQLDELPNGVSRVKDWVAVLEYFENERRS